MAALHGKNFVAGSLGDSDRTFVATSPLDRGGLPGRFFLASLTDVETAMQAAAAAAQPFAHTKGEARAVFLERIADEIMALGDDELARQTFMQSVPSHRALLAAAQRTQGITHA
jgi:NADP-dependent aldehyde dehydrogenase